ASPSALAEDSLGNPVLHISPPERESQIRKASAAGIDEHRPDSILTKVLFRQNGLSPEENGWHAFAARFRRQRTGEKHRESMSSPKGPPSAAELPHERSGAFGAGGFSMLSRCLFRIPGWLQTSRESMAPAMRVQCLD